MVVTAAKAVARAAVTEAKAVARAARVARVVMTRLLKPGSVRAFGADDTAGLILEVGSPTDVTFQLSERNAEVPGGKG